MMKVFLTGATGFVGRHIAKELQAHGHTVSGLARSDSSVQQLISAGVTPVHGSLSDHAVLTTSAKDADAVIHTAFNHNWTAPDYDREKNCQSDLEALQAMVAGIKGTDKPIINTSPTLAAPKGQILTEDTSKSPEDLRTRTEDYFKKIAKEGVSAITVRLAPSVHGEGDKMFVKIYVNMARKKGYVFYVDDGSAVWPGCSVLDVAVLYRLAIEKKLPPGTVLHAIEDELHSTKEIAETISQNAGVPTKSITMEEAQKTMGFLGVAFGTSNPTTKEKTVEMTGWRCEHQNLLDDMKQYYFKD